MDTVVTASCMCLPVTLLSLCSARDPHLSSIEDTLSHTCYAWIECVHCYKIELAAVDILPLFNLVCVRITITGGDEEVEGKME